MPRLIAVAAALVFLAALPASAQSTPSEADSLRREHRGAPDSTRVRLLFDLGYASQEQPVEAARAFRQSATLARRTGDFRGLARAHYGLARQALLADGAPAVATAHLDTAGVAARRAADPVVEASVYNLRARTLAVSGDNPGSLRALLRAIGLWEEMRGSSRYDADAHVGALINLGHVHGDLGDQDAALARYTEARALADETDLPGRSAAALMSIGSVYDLRGDPARAATIYRQALDAQIRTGNRRGATFARANLAQVYGQLGRGAESVTLFRDAVATAEDLGDPTLTASLRAGYADALLDLGRTDDALVQARQSLADLAGLDAPRDQLRALEALAFATAASGRAGESGQLRARASVLRDSLLGVDRAAEGERVRAEFDVERQEAEIVALEEKQVLDQAVLDRQRLLLALIGTGLLFAVGAVVSVVRTGRLRRQADVLAERTRIAREIHDTLLQGFTAVTLQTQVAADQIGRDPDAAQQALGRALDQADRVLVDARQSIWDRRPPALDGRTLGQAIRDLGPSTGDATDVPAVSVQVSGTPRTLSDDAEADLIRIASEALANARRHADATRVDLRLAYEPRALTLTIEDDGRGFRPDGPAAARAGHWGLLGMHERAARLGATLAIDSAPGDGARLRLHLERPAWTD